jgi:pyruvate ferredoxin oxidoreductase gamma subunit
MFQVRIHGRGGQGVVTAAELLSIAAFREGRHAQAFPSFGSERMGAPIVAFCRIDDHEIRSREPVTHPDALIIQDPTLLHSVDVFQGPAPDGYVLLNSSRDFDQLGVGEFVRGFPPGQAVTMPATDLARSFIGRPIPNAVLLGGFAALTGVLSLDSVIAAIAEKFPGAMGQKNIQAARAAYTAIANRQREEVGAC